MLFKFSDLSVMKKKKNWINFVQSCLKSHPVSTIQFVRKILARRLGTFQLEGHISGQLVPFLPAQFLFIQLVTLILFSSYLASQLHIYLVSYPRQLVTYLFSQLPIQLVSYISSQLPIQIVSYLSRQLATYLFSQLPIYLVSYLSSQLATYLVSQLPIYLVSYLSSQLVTYLFSQLPIQLVSYLSSQLVTYLDKYLMVFIIYSV